MRTRLYHLVEISLLAAFISVSGMIKLPTFVMGSEFQMSAPIAVAICAIFGFKRYIIAGILSSLILFLLGLHTIVNVLVAMVFRLVVGFIISLFGSHPLVIAISGPLGTFVARYVLAMTLQIPFTVLVMPALPGMILTAITAIPLTKILQKIYHQVGVKKYETTL